MLALYFIFMTIISPLLILFIIIALIRYFKYKPPFFTSHGREFVPYDYYKMNGKRSIPLTIVFGSFGILYANIGFGFLIFFINSILYCIVFAHTIFETDTPVTLVLIPIARIMNIIVMILFNKIRLKMNEKKFHTYVEHELAGIVNLAHFEKDKNLSEVKRQHIQQKRFKEEKSRLYEKWKEKFT